jgi:hypothetical protein
MSNFHYEYFVTFQNHLNQQMVFDHQVINTLKYHLEEKKSDIKFSREKSLNIHIPHIRIQ